MSRPRVRKSEVYRPPAPEPEPAPVVEPVPVPPVAVKPPTALDPTVPVCTHVDYNPVTRTAKLTVDGKALEMILTPVAQECARMNFGRL